MSPAEPHGTRKTDRSTLGEPGTASSARSNSSAGSPESTGPKATDHPADEPAGLADLLDEQPVQESPETGVPAEDRTTLTPVEAFEAARDGSPDDGQPQGQEEVTGPTLDTAASMRGGEAGSRRLVLMLVGVAAALLALEGISRYASFIAPVFFALNMVIIVHPLHAWLVRRLRWPVWLAAITALAVVLIALLAFFYSMGWAIFALLTALPGYSGEFAALGDDLMQWLAQFGVTTETMAANIEANVPDIVGFSTEWLLDVASNVSGVATMLAIVITAIFFLTLDSMTIRRRMGVILLQKPLVGRALLSFAAGVRRYWIVTTVFGLIVALMDLGYLWALGIPLAGVWAVLAFVTNYIPNIGFVIGMIPPTMMGLLEGGWLDALAVILGFSVINLVMQSFIQPKFTGDAVGVTPLVSFVSVLLWSLVLGPLGALLALPATLLVKALLVDPNPDVRFVNALIASSPEDGLSSAAAEQARASRGALARWISGTTRRRRRPSPAEQTSSAKEIDGHTDQFH
ncbi:AI-2E family transporter [Kocuria palustris]|uniref:AI-2E family transporter n=1 Tax=Kocuria palustris TaxID=71999 RepID=UPI003D70F02D